MAEIATIARPYAEALFKLADESRRLGEWSSLLSTLVGVASADEMQSIVDDPRVTTGQLYEVVLAGARAELSPETKSFVRLLIDNKRLGLLPAIGKQFEILKREREGAVEAEVHTAFPLDDAQLAQLVAELERRVGRKVNPRVSVDRELIGGMRVVIGDQVIEASVRGKLSAMAAALAHM